MNEWMKNSTKLSGVKKTSKKFRNEWISFINATRNVFSSIKKRMKEKTKAYTKEQIK